MVEHFQNVERLWQADILPIRSEGLVTRSKQDEEALKLLQTLTYARLLLTWRPVMFP